MTLEQEGKEVLRHPGVTNLLSFFTSDHLPTPLAVVSDVMGNAAHWAVENLGEGPELTAGLRKLLEAKDCFVRQALVDGGK